MSSDESGGQLQISVAPIKPAALLGQEHAEEPSDATVHAKTMTQHERWQLFVGGVQSVTLIATLVVVWIYTGHTRKQADAVTEQTRSLAEQAHAASDQARAAIDQAHSATQQSDIASRQLEVSLRPWIEIGVEITGPIVFTQKEMSVPLKFAFKNVGHSPAMMVSLRAKIVFSPNVMNPAAAQAKLCDVQSTAGLMPVSQALFVNDIAPSIMILNESLEKAGNSFGAHFVAPSLIGCADYAFDFREGHHVTGFVYQLVVHDSRPGVYAVVPAPKVPNVVLMPGSIGTGAVN